MKVKVKSYTRHTKSGKTITIKEHERGPRRGKNGRIVERPESTKEGAGDELKAKVAAKEDEQKKKYQENLKNLSEEDIKAWIKFEADRKAQILNGTLRQGLHTNPKMGTNSKQEEILKRAEEIGKKRRAAGISQADEDFATRSGITSLNRRMEKGLDSFIKKYGSKKGYKRYL